MGTVGTCLFLLLTYYVRNKSKFTILLERRHAQLYRRRWRWFRFEAAFSFVTFCASLFFCTLKGRTHSWTLLYIPSKSRQTTFRLFFLIWYRDLLQRCSVNGIASRHAAPFISLVACESIERHLQPATRVMAASFRNKVHGMFRVLLVTYALDGNARFQVARYRIRNLWSGLRVLICLALQFCV